MGRRGRDSLTSAKPDMWRSGYWFPPQDCDLPHTVEDTRVARRAFQSASVTELEENRDGTLLILSGWGRLTHVVAVHRTS